MTLRINEWKEVCMMAEKTVLYSSRITGNPWSQQADSLQPFEKK